MDSKEVKTKKIFALTVLTLFLLSFSLNFVAAADSPVSQGAGSLFGSNENAASSSAATIFNPIKQWFVDWEDGENFSANIAKYLFWALVSMVVWSIGKNIPGLDSLFINKDGDNSFLGWAFAIIIGFLSMAYVTPDEVYAIMITYSALGFTIGGFLPIIILIYFTMTQAAESKSKSGFERLGSRIVALVMWIAFDAFLLLKAINATGGSIALSWIMFAAAAAITVFLKPVFKKIRKTLKEEQKDRFEEKLKEQALKRDAEAADVESQ